jgi:sugar phosphate isomerase/epimerase
MSLPAALQLYTLRQELARDYAGVIRRVAEMGYVGVETAGFPGSSLSEAVRLFRDLGLSVCSAHVPLLTAETEREVAETAHQLATRYVVSGLGPDDFKDRETILRTAERFNRAAGLAGRHGLTFAIHNHWWEFGLVGGEPAYRILLAHLDPAVRFQVDVYWARTAGADPAAVIRELGARAPLLHIKDGPCVKDEPMTAVGDGVVDFAAIAGAARSHVEWMIVELDHCATDMVTAVDRSLQFLTRNGYAHGRNP